MSGAISLDNGVYRVGGGACTSVGRTLWASAAAVRAGVASFGDHPFMVDSIGEPMVVARASYLSDDIVGLERLLILASPAAEEALSILLPFVGQIRPFPVVVGLPSCRPGLPAALEEEFPERLRQQLVALFPIARVEAIAFGHSSGLMALESGWKKIQSGAADFCLVGGVDSYMEPEALEWLEECEQIHSAGPKNNAWGFIPGEAAGFCLLASAKAVRHWEMDHVGKVRAVAVTREENLIKTDSVCLAHGLTAAFERAFDSLRTPQEKVDDIICDMNGEPYRAEEFGFATIRTNNHFVNASDFHAPADCWGDVGAASGPLFVNLSVIAHKKGYSQGTRTLV